MTTSKDPNVDRLYMPDDRYLAALERQKARIEAGVPLVLDDSDAIGAKHTHATWGLCSNDKEAFPDASDHLWPDLFEKDGRFAPRYLKAEKGQLCPMDTRPYHSRPATSSDYLNGCFHTCRLFRPGKRPRAENAPPQHFGVPTREEAVQLYQITISRARERAKDKTG